MKNFFISSYKILKTRFYCSLSNHTWTHRNPKTRVNHCTFHLYSWDPFTSKNIGSHYLKTPENSPHVAYTENFSLHENPSIVTSYRGARLILLPTKTLVYPILQLYHIERFFFLSEDKGMGIIPLGGQGDATGSRNIRRKEQSGINYEPARMIEYSAFRQRQMYWRENFISDLLDTGYIYIYIKNTF